MTLYSAEMITVIRVTALSVHCSEGIDIEDLAHPMRLLGLVILKETNMIKSRFLLLLVLFVFFF